MEQIFAEWKLMRYRAKEWCLLNGVLVRWELEWYTNINIGVIVKPVRHFVYYCVLDYTIWIRYKYSRICIPQAFCGYYWRISNVQHKNHKCGGINSGEIINRPGDLTISAILDK